jgi:hypothetical protein
MTAVGWHFHTKKPAAGILPVLSLLHLRSDARPFFVDQIIRIYMRLDLKQTLHLAVFVEVD